MFGIFSDEISYYNFTLLKQIDMRERTAEPRQIFSVYLPTSLYQKLVDRAGKGKINTFIKQVLEKELASEKQQLISDYQSVAESKKAQKEAEI